VLRKGGRAYSSDHLEDLAVARKNDLDFIHHGFSSGDMIDGDVKIHACTFAIKVEVFYLGDGEPWPLWLDLNRKVWV
jgi:hypothetical protein